MHDKTSQYTSESFITTTTAATATSLKTGFLFTMLKYMRLERKGKENISEWP